MPKLLAKVEGKGNGTETILANMPEIAKSLNRPPMYPTKYIGALLSAQAKYDQKSERYIISGAHDTNKLQDLLDGFIQKYVTCQSCNNQDTTLSVDKKKPFIRLACKSCSRSEIVPTANDSFAPFILKNPPSNLSGALATSSEAGGMANKAGSSTKKERGSENQDDEVDDLDSDDLEELDYGDDDDDYDYNSRTEESQEAGKQGSSSQQTYMDSMSHQDEDDEDIDEEYEGYVSDDGPNEVDPDEFMEEHPNRHEDNAGQSDTEKNGDKIRCRYWPSCKAQESCQFYHPTIPCKDFLRCNFGDKCLYIHPPCKFSPNCTKPTCPFYHPAVVTAGVKRKAPIAMPFRNVHQPAAPKCKFGFKCTNLMCKFSHQASEDCRYGTNCLLESCPYNHPTDSMPRKKPANVFKWSAQS